MRHNSKVMNGDTIYHVIFDGKHYYFGSVAAIYDRFTPAQLGITMASLWNYDIEGDKPYSNKKCIVYKGLIHRKTKNRKQQND